MRNDHLILPPHLARERELPFAANRTPEWTSFYRAAMPTYTPEERERRILATMADTGFDRATVEQAFDDSLKTKVIFLNNRYQVAAFWAGGDNRPADGPEVVHLSIKRIDKAPVGPERYRDFMRIKDELVGPECEAMEIYPARSREVDTANQYHLWVFADPSVRIPLGFSSGRVVTERMTSGGKQAAFDPHHAIPLPAEYVGPVLAILRDECP